MKYLVGFAVMVLSFAVPAAAQTHAAGGGSGTGFGTTSGGGAGGAAVPGGVGHLPHYAPTRFQVTNVTGTPDYIPSTFIPYNNAVTEGNVTLASVPETVGQAAQLNRETPKVKAKLALVQDRHGNAVIEPR